MSASLSMKITVQKGGEDAVNAIVRELCIAEGIENGQIPVFGLRISKDTIRVDNSGFRNIWGENYLCPNSALYERLAKAAPDTEWHAYSHRLFEGGGEGCEAEDEAIYENHVLKYCSNDSFDSLSFNSLCEIILDPWGDIEYNIEHLRDGENKFFFNGTFDNRPETSKLIADWIRDNGSDIIDELPAEGDDTVFVISDVRQSEAVKTARKLGIPVLSGADFIALFVGYYDFEEFAENADIVFDSSQFAEEYNDHITFDAVKLVFNVDESFTEKEFEALRKVPNHAEMQLSAGDYLGLAEGLEKYMRVIEI